MSHEKARRSKDRYLKVFQRNLCWYIRYAHLQNQSPRFQNHSFSCNIFQQKSKWIQTAGVQLSCWTVRGEPSGLRLPRPNCDVAGRMRYRNQISDRISIIEINLSQNNETTKVQVDSTTITLDKGLCGYYLVRIVSAHLIVATKKLINWHFDFPNVAYTVFFWGS